MIVPEKIFLIPDRMSNGLSVFWYELPYSTGSIEYIRVDNHESKDIDLDKEIEDYVEQHKSELSGYFDIRRIARHFFKLGLSVKIG